MFSQSKSVMEFALSYPVDVRCVPLKGFHITLKADERTRCKLAKNHGLLTVDDFFACFHIGTWKKRGRRIQGYIKALIRQKCIITAESLENCVNQTVDVIYVPEDFKLSGFSEDGTRPETLDILRGNEIDAGAVAEEFFELSIDPYPRKPDALFTPLMAFRMTE